MFVAPLRIISRNRPRAVAAAGVALLLGVALLDWSTGPDFTMGLLYLVPVTLVTLAVGRAWGMVMAALTVVVWITAELLGAAVYSHVWVAVPNALMRGAYMALIVYLVSVWKRFHEQLEAQVAQRTQELVAEVAERKQAEQAVHRLVLQISDAEDAQRRRIAQDIHDTVGQTLTLMKLRLQTATAASAVVPSSDSSSDSTTGDAAIADAIQLLDDAIKQTRTLTFELYPPMLDDLGLAAALRWLARELSRQADVQIAVREEGDARPIEKTIGSYLFRSVRELINNSIKHGRSSEVIVTVYWRPSSLRIAVDDNGNGFEPSISGTAEPAGLGLLSIRERVTTLGGTMSVESATGSGTRVIIDVPTVSGV